MNELLKLIVINEVEVRCWFAGYNVFGQERYEYGDPNGVPGYFTRERG